MTVTMLLANTTSMELTEWSAFFQVEEESRKQHEHEQAIRREFEQKWGV